MLGISPPPRRTTPGRAAAALVVLVAGAFWASPAEALPWRPRVLKEVQYEPRYLGVLERWAQGDEAAGVAALLALDEDLVSRQPKDPLSVLAKGKRRLLDDVVEGAPDALVSLVRLHEEAYVRGVPLGNATLAAHYRITTAQLASRLGAEGDDEERRLAAAFLASLAGHAHAAYQSTPAGDLYRKALALDPGLRAARLGLASIEEKRGNYGAALDSLRPLLASGGAPAEAVLRFGVNLLRLGQRSEGVRRLRELTEGPAPTWVASLAYQELGRALLDDGEARSAAAVLAEGVARFPCDASLTVALAYAEERTGRNGGDLGAALRSCGVGTTSPRSRYNRVPEGVFEELRHEIAVEAVARRGALAWAVEGGPR